MGLQIAVELPSDLFTPGEFLADVRAYEAAGADAVWLAPAALEPLTLAAAALAVTSRIEVVAWLGAPGRWPPELLGTVARTLASLGRDQVSFGVAGAPEAAARAIAVLQAAHPDVLVYVDGEHARDVSGQVRDLAASAAHFERTRASGPGPDYRYWARLPAPGGRAAWREGLAAAEQAGATGVAVAHAPNLLDILRNPEEDDRQDLAMATG